MLVDIKLFTLIVWRGINVFTVERSLTPVVIAAIRLHRELH